MSIYLLFSFLLYKLVFKMLWQQKVFVQLSLTEGSKGFVYVRKFKVKHEIIIRSFFKINFDHIAVVIRVIRIQTELHLRNFVTLYSILMWYFECKMSSCDTGNKKLDLYVEYLYGLTHQTLIMCFGLYFPNYTYHIAIGATDSLFESLRFHYHLS